MIITKSRITEKWFSKDVSMFDAFRLVIYRQSQNLDNVFGFKREDFYTKIIELRQDLDQIFESIGKNTKYKINRASREGVHFTIEEDLNVFLDFYNEFSRSKSLSTLSKKVLRKYNNNLVVTKATKSKSESENLVMHSYIVDFESKRVRLLHSASLFRTDDKKIRNLVGMANRFLHFEDMKYFKEHNFKVYDFGGYAYNTVDEQLKNINDFKDSFGATLLHESNYTSWILNIFIKMTKILKG